MKRKPRGSHPSQIGFAYAYTLAGSLYREIKTISGTDPAHMPDFGQERPSQTSTRNRSKYMRRRSLSSCRRNSGDASQTLGCVRLHPLLIIKIVRWLAMRLKDGSQVVTHFSQCRILPIQYL